MLVEAYYRAIVCHFKVSPSEFWRMTPNEAALFIDSHESQSPSASKLTDEQYERLEAKRKALEAKGVVVL